MISVNNKCLFSPSLYLYGFVLFLEEKEWRWPWMLVETFCLTWIKKCQQQCVRPEIVWQHSQKYYSHCILKPVKHLTLRHRILLQHIKWNPFDIETVQHNEPFSDGRTRHICVHSVAAIRSTSMSKCHTNKHTNIPISPAAPLDLLTDYEKLQSINSGSYPPTLPGQPC